MNPSKFNTVLKLIAVAILLALFFKSQLFVWAVTAVVVGLVLGFAVWGSIWLWTGQRPKLPKKK